MIDLMRRRPRFFLYAFTAALALRFTAAYTAVALTETWSIFFTSLALWSAVKGNGVPLGARGRRDRSATRDHPHRHSVTLLRL